MSFYEETATSHVDVEIYESADNLLTAFYIDASSGDVVYMDRCGRDGLWEMTQDYVAVAVAGDDLSRWECPFDEADFDREYGKSVLHDTLIAKSYTGEFYGATDTTQGRLGIRPDMCGRVGGAFAAMLLDDIEE